MEDKRGHDREEIYSQKVKAGKRTYFFDVKSTRSNDYYITITESKKKTRDGDDGFFFEKHKIFLYKEDFHKFAAAIQETIEHVKEELLPEVDFTEFERENSNWE
ncbi:MAG: DUF3276 family protein [Cyclobacteriaceae bacterium]